MEQHSLVVKVTIFFTNLMSPMNIAIPQSVILYFLNLGMVRRIRGVVRRVRGVVRE